MTRMTSPLILGFLEGPELFIVLAIVLVLFGGTALPKLARSLGSAQKEFKKGLSESEEDEKPATGKSDSTSA